jgi:hypothetical protein
MLAAGKYRFPTVTFLHNNGLLIPLYWLTVRAIDFDIFKYYPIDKPNGMKYGRVKKKKWNVANLQISGRRMSLRQWQCVVDFIGDVMVLRVGNGAALNGGGGCVLELGAASVIRYILVQFCYKGTENLVAVTHARFISAICQYVEFCRRNVIFNTKLMLCVES